MTKQQLLKKQDRLRNAKSVLKASFFGIDDVIDQLVDSVSSWYLSPELQDRPTVINLWGLTGVGKTSLVQKLTDLLGLSDDTYHIDLGEVEGSNNPLKSVIDNLGYRGNGQANVIILDEFQLMRTIGPDGMEQRLPGSRIVWQLLDTGVFYEKKPFYQYSESIEIIQKFKYLLKNGIKVENGCVVEGVEKFNEMMNQTLFRSYIDIQDQRTLFLNNDARDMIFDCLRSEYDNIFTLNNYLDTLDGAQSIAMAERALYNMSLPFKVNFTMSLVLILGNLDDLYPMTRSLNPDMSADDIYELSRDITLPDVKKALQDLFRNEQIARLGNRHIIYPSLNKAAFESIIQKELDSLALKMKSTSGLRFSFDTSLHDIIYREGVFPAQGARPVLSTIHDVVRSKLPDIAIEATLKGFKKCDIHLSFSEENVLCEFTDGNGCKKHRFELPHPLKLEPLREESLDDVQAIVAVHEAGHAVACVALLKLMPDSIASKSADSSNNGFVHVKNSLPYRSRAMILNQLACHLAGFVAEKIVFGEENVTLGSNSDIQGATREILQALMDYGMGERVASFHIKSPSTVNFMHDEGNRISAEAEVWLQSAMSLAEETLRREERLLIAVANYLSDHSRLNQGDFISFVRKYGAEVNVDAILDQEKPMHYRSAVKRKLKQLEHVIQVAV